MRKFLGVIIIFAMLVGVVGCAEQSQSVELKPLTGDDEIQFYVDGSNLSRHLIDVVTNNETFNEEKIESLYKKYSDYNLTEEQDKFMKSVKLLVFDTKKYLEAVKSGDKKKIEDMMKLFDYDCEETLNLFKEFNKNKLN